MSPNKWSSHGRFKLGPCVYTENRSLNLGSNFEPSMTKTEQCVAVLSLFLTQPQYSDTCPSNVSERWCRDALIERTGIWDGSCERVLIPGVVPGPAPVISVLKPVV